MRAFSQADRFFSELESRELKPAYVLVGDEAFFRKRCRDAILEHLVAPDSRDFGLFEFDLAETSLNEVLDRARTPSLMAPFQVFFVRGVRLCLAAVRAPMLKRSEPSRPTARIPIQTRCWCLLPITSAFPPTPAAWR